MSTLAQMHEPPMLAGPWLFPQHGSLACSEPACWLHFGSQLHPAHHSVTFSCFTWPGGSVVNALVEDSPHKLFVSGLPTHMGEAEVGGIFTQMCSSGYGPPLAGLS